MSNTIKFMPVHMGYPYDPSWKVALSNHTVKHLIVEIHPFSLFNQVTNHLMESIHIEYGFKYSVSAQELVFEIGEENCKNLSEDVQHIFACIRSNMKHEGSDYVEFVSA